MRRVYDFDGTIFDGDSTARFVGFVIKRRWSVLLGAPRVGWHFLLYALKIETKTTAKQALYRCLLGRLRDGELDGLVADFWKRDRSRIKEWYRAGRPGGGVIISASPDFLLSPIAKELGERLISSRVDPRTGTYIGGNCDGAEKVRRFREEGLDHEPFEFFSDAMIDAPMAAIAKKAWLVKGEEVLPWPEAHGSPGRGAGREA